MNGLGDVGKSLSNAIMKGVGRSVARAQESRPLPVDVLESDEEYLVVFDAPGATKSDVQVRYVDRTVLVRIDRFREFFESFEMRFPGRGLSLDGHVDLPEDAAVDPDAASATLTKRGTLEVRLPKRRSTGEHGVAVADEADADDGPPDHDDGGLDLEGADSDHDADGDDGPDHDADAA